MTTAIQRSAYPTTVRAGMQQGQTKSRRSGRKGVLVASPPKLLKVGDVVRGKVQLLATGNFAIRHLIPGLALYWLILDKQSVGNLVEGQEGEVVVGDCTSNQGDVRYHKAHLPN